MYPPCQCRHRNCGRSLSICCVDQGKILLRVVISVGRILSACSGTSVSFILTCHYCLEWILALPQEHVLSIPYPTYKTHIGCFRQHNTRYFEFPVKKEVWNQASFKEAIIFLTHGVFLLHLHTAS